MNAVADATNNATAVQDQTAQSSADTQPVDNQHTSDDSAVTDAQQQQNQTDDNSGAADDQGKAGDQHKDNRIQRRIDKLTREKYELKGRLEALEGIVRSGGTPGQQQQANARPQRDKYETHEDYLEALTVYNERLIDEMPKRMSDSNAEAGFQKKMTEGKTLYADWDDAVDESDALYILPHVQRELKSTDSPADVFYYLAKNPDEAARLNNLDARQVAREFAKIEAKAEIVRKSTQASATKSPVSKAPAPVQPVASRGVQAKRDHLKHPEDYTTAEWIAAERERKAKLNKG